MNPLMIFGIVGILVVVLIGGVVAFMVFGRRQSAVDERLGQLSQVAAPVEAAGPKRSRMGESLDKAVQGFSFTEGIKRTLARADVKLTVAEYLIVQMLCALGGAVVAAVVFQSPFAAPLGIAGWFAPGVFVGFQQGQRLSKFDNQLGDMLNLVVNGLRAGYSSMQALESVSKELPPPISVEFKRVVQEIQLGLPQEQALANLCRRIPSADLDFVVTAINVQREVGGNLAEILDTISFTIRERVRIKGEIQSLTAQGQMTAWVISGLPIALGLFLFLINRSYMMNFFGPPMFLNIPICGICALATALGMIVTGFLIVQKIVNIEV